MSPSSSTEWQRWQASMTVWSVTGMPSSPLSSLSGCWAVAPGERAAESRSAAAAAAARDLIRPVRSLFEGQVARGKPFSCDGLI